MQVIFENINERNNSKRTSAVSIGICLERISRYLEIKCNKIFRSRNIGVWNSGEGFKINK